MKTLLAGLLLAAALGCSSKEGDRVTESKRPALMAASIPPIDAAAPAKVETATFALGCFWCPDAQFGVLPGVVRTRVGYCGGTLKDPTYHELGDHTESVQVDYDPAKMTFVQLLDRIWESHNPCGVGGKSRQYMSAIFYHDEEQKKAVEASKGRVEEKLGQTVKTRILPLGKFYWAEDYHQKYELRCNEALIKEFTVIYPNARDLANSTAAARVNGYIAGKGSLEQLKLEIDQLGLSPEGKKQLQLFVR